MNNPKHEQLPCQQFSCGGPQQYCISQDLTCDGVNHCGDGTDEDERAHCVDDSAGHQIMGIGVSVFLTLLLIAFTFCLLCIAAIVFCVCRRGPQDYTPSQVALQNGRPLMNGPNGMMGAPGLQSTTITPFGTFPGKAPGDELGLGGLQPGSHSTFPLRAPLNPNGKPVNQSASGENWLV
ncbi:hypothetical protein BIW11_09666 [Tropilaelaps mercedesae]|uniref:Uncharacterized protein n=1 Tax=Tropilaelaps mercedesae TaxID=418985 RepID=A0A1V9XJL0_9ACAR|nr:hypothetical protein BIW11_09666 [Tropilaelaps mercedesae]